MGWFGVEQDFYERPKFRKLMKLHGCGACESMGILVVLWSWGVENAAKDGQILEADKDYLEAYLFGKNINGRIPFGHIVDPLIESGWLDEVDGKLFIHDWDFWQAALYKAKERRAIDAERKREYRARTPDPEQTSFEDVDPTHEPVAPDSDTPKRAEYAPAFEEFWSVYPRNIGKGDAYKKYQARRKDGFSDEELILAAKNYANECKRKGTEKSYIKHPKTFLSETTPFVDYLPKQSPAPSIGSGGNPFRTGGGS